MPATHKLELFRVFGQRHQPTAHGRRVVSLPPTIRSKRADKFARRHVAGRVSMASIEIRSKAGGRPRARSTVYGNVSHLGQLGERSSRMYDRIGRIHWRSRRRPGQPLAVRPGKSNSRQHHAVVRPKRASPSRRFLGSASSRRRCACGSTAEIGEIDGATIARRTALRARADPSDEIRKLRLRLVRDLDAAGSNSR